MKSVEGKYIRLRVLMEYERLHCLIYPSAHIKFALEVEPSINSTQVRINSYRQAS